MSGLFASSGAELSALGSVFVKLLNISIAAGWIVLAAVLLRKLLKRAPKWAVCLLWLVLALRLVLPFSIESPLSLVPSAETVVVTESRAPAESASPASQSGGFSLDETTASPGFSVEIHSGFATVNSFVNPIISGAEGSGRAQQSDAAGQPGSAEERSPAAPSEGAARSASLAGFIDGLGAVWAAGVIALLAYGAISFAGLRRKVRASVPWPQAAAGSTDGRALGSAFASRPQEAGKASPRRLRVLICDDIDSPFILGILRPKVYLPSGLSDAEIEHILSHEQAHIARRDHLWKPLGFALLAVYWFNPLMWLAYALFCRDIELACDEKVVRAMDEGGKAAYSRTLVSCSSRQRLVTACPLAFGEVGTGERVKSVLNYKRPAFWIITLAVIVCIVLAVCFLTNPKSGGSGSKDGSNVQGQVYVWFDSVSYSGKTGYEIEVLEQADGTEVTLPDFPGISFKTNLKANTKTIYMIKDGTAVPVIDDYTLILNAFFCDINEDGKPELCATCMSDPDASARFIFIYDIENNKYYELSERGFDYTLAERNGWLIAMKRTHQEESSVGADVVLAIKDGRLAMAPLGDDAGTVVQLSPVNLISGNSNMVKTGEKYTITVDGTPYYLVTKVTSYLPFGYTQVGTISKEQAGKSFVAGLPYFRAAGHDDIYVYAEHAVTPGDLMLSSEIYIGYMHFSPNKDAVWTMTLDDVLFLADKGNITRDDFKSFVTLDREATKGESYSIRIDDMYSVFVRFDGTGRADMCKLGKYDFTEVVNVLTEDVQAFIDAHYVVDIIDTAEVHATALEKFWESGGLEFWFPSIQSEGMYVVTADGNRTPLKEALEDRLILVTDIPRFGHKVYIGGLYEGELTGLTPDAARLAQLKAHVPQFFGVDSSKGLTIYVYSLASQHYSCGILPGDAQGVDMIGSSQSGSLTRDDVLLILKSEYPDVPDSKITVRPYFNPISSYLVIDKEAYANQLKALFGGRFKVGSSIGFMINDPDNTAQAGVQPSAEQKRTPEHITALESESPALDKGFAGESIDVLLGSKPDMTGRVMHVFVTSFGPNEYNCIIYMNARYAALPQVPVNAKSYSVGEVKQLITNWGLSDEQVVLHNYQHPMSSYIDEMGEEHLKAISAQFDDKYPVVDNGETHYYKYLNSIEHALD